MGVSRPTREGLSAESGFFRAKIAREELIKDSSIPYSIVHATQFFEFINGIADAATNGTAVKLPPALIQPMAADDAATALARVAVGPPLNDTVEIAGPDHFRLDERISRAEGAQCSATSSPIHVRATSGSRPASAHSSGRRGAPRQDATRQRAQEGHRPGAASRRAGHGARRCMRSA